MFAIFGGNGYTEDYPMARMFRDARIGTIGAGTPEIMRDIIAKIIIDDVKYEKAKSNINTKDNHSLNKNILLDSLENKKDLVSVQSLLIAEDTLNITIKHINSSDKTEFNKRESQAIRHQIAQLASEIECSKHFVYSIINCDSNVDKEKEHLMASLLCLQIMNKVVAECFDIFGYYPSLDQHPLEKYIKNQRLFKFLTVKLIYLIAYLL